MMLIRVIARVIGVAFAFLSPRPAFAKKLTLACTMHGLA
jgi:hypothetical protein